MVQARYAAGGALTMVCNGQTFAGTTITAATDLVADSMGWVTATGLTAGTSYAFGLYLGGVLQESGTLKTMPAAGTELWLVGTSCLHGSKSAACLDAAVAMAGNKLAAFLGQGDIPYMCMSSTSTSWYPWTGAATQDIELCGDVTSQSSVKGCAFTKSLAVRSTPGLKTILAAAPAYYILSDHDAAPSNNIWSDATLADYNAYHAGAFANLGQGQQVTAWLQEVWRKAYAKGNPSNSHASRDTNWAVDEQSYYTFVVGDVTVIACDTTTYQINTGRKFGNTQLTWLQSQLSAAATKYKVLMIDQGLTESDTTLAGSTDWTTILNYIAAQSITGCLVLSGDIHSWSVARDAVATIRGCPGMQDTTAVPDGYPRGTAHKQYGNATASLPTAQPVTGPGSCHYIRVAPTENRMYVGIIDGAGSKVWEAYLTPTTNTLAYPVVGRV